MKVRTLNKEMLCKMQDNLLEELKTLKCFPKKEICALFIVHLYRYMIDYCNFVTYKQYSIDSDESNTDVNLVKSYLEASGYDYESKEQSYFDILGNICEELVCCTNVDSNVEFFLLSFVDLKGEFNTASRGVFRVLIPDGELLNVLLDGSIFRSVYYEIFGYEQRRGACKRFLMAYDGNISEYAKSQAVEYGFSDSLVCSVLVDDIGLKIVN